jgi:thiamine-monophosphate kinase
MSEPVALDQLGEFGLIARLAAQTKSKKNTLIGIGDDAALLAAPDKRVLFCTDVLVEGQHFRRDWATALEIGRRSAAASMADIAAMGGITTGLVVGLAAPGDLPAHWAVELHAGLQEEAARVGASVVGGDVTEAELVVIAVAAVGDLGGAKPVQRSGARPGDTVAVAGRLGYAAAGLAILRRGFKAPRALVDAYRVPEPPYRSGPAAAKAGATAMIDVSDGLIGDARHIAAASHVNLQIDVDRLEVPDTMREIAAAYTLDPLEWVMTGGDDHALLATFPSRRLPRGFRAIGRVVDGDGEVLINGATIEKAGGHEHFRRE